jgi:hypothetical protein
VSSVFTAATKEHWLQARHWLYYTVGVGCIPFWGIVWLYWLIAKQLQLSMFVGEAQLAVYAAGLLAPAMPVIIRDIKDSPFKQPAWFLVVAVVSVAAIAFTFAAAVTNEDVSVTRLAIASFLFFFLSIVMGFFVELINNVRSDPDVIAVQRKQLEKLSGQVRKSLEDNQ